MIKLENVEVHGWDAAIRGMRNPMNSWDKSDSSFPWGEYGSWQVGENDLKLMKSLSKAGSDHGKFLRMITVTVDITAPLYWWKEFDTYKVGTVANSCSTMHKIVSEPITRDSFSFDKELDNVMTFECEDQIPWCIVDDFESVIETCERLRLKYLETKDKRIWRALIQILPEGWNQKRTIQLNYQVLKSMYFARKTHKLDEWREFCQWCEELPYFKEICIQE